MSRRAALLGIVVASSLAGCVAGPVVPGKAKEVRGQPLPPREVREECFAMDRGDELKWRFAADAPLDFGVHFRDGRAVVMPVTRERVTADEGRFVALSGREYCASWEAGAKGLTLDYSLELVRPRR